MRTTKFSFFLSFFLRKLFPSLNYSIRLSETKLLFLVPFILITISSCNKDEQTQPNVQLSGVIEENETETYTYYLDNVLVPEGTYDPIDSTLWVATLLLPEPNDLSNIRNYKVHAFTTSNGYINFGNEKGLPLDKYVQFEDAVNSYPDSITQQIADAIYSRIFGNTASSRTPAIIGHDICSGDNSGGTTVILRAQPIYFTLKDKLSMVEAPIAIYVGLGCWDRSFYRKRLGSFWFWGARRVCLPKHLDNKIASSVHS